MRCTRCTRCRATVPRALIHAPSNRHTTYSSPLALPHWSVPQMSPIANAAAPLAPLSYHAAARPHPQLPVKMRSSSMCACASRYASSPPRCPGLSLFTTSPPAPPTTPSALWYPLLHSITSLVRKPDRRLLLSFLRIGRTYLRSSIFPLPPRFFSSSISVISTTLFDLLLLPFTFFVEPPQSTQR